jgi:hypothetical protein
MSMQNKLECLSLLFKSGVQGFGFETTEYTIRTEWPSNSSIEVIVRELRKTADLFECNEKKYASYKVHFTVGDKVKFFSYEHFSGKRISGIGIVIDVDQDENFVSIENYPERTFVRHYRPCDLEKVKIDITGENHG